MSQRTLMAKTGATPAKLALIGVLAVVLIGVIAMQFSGSSSQPHNRPPRANGAARAAKPAAVRRTTAEQAAPATESKQTSWPEHPLQTVLVHDPFGPPAWSRAPGELDAVDVVDAADASERASLEADRQILERLKTSGVSMVMISDGSRVARVGDLELREGDRIGGCVVREITTDGVVLFEDVRP